MSIGTVRSGSPYNPQAYEAERDRLKAETDAEHLKNMKETLEAKKATWDKSVMTSFN